MAQSPQPKAFVQQAVVFSVPETLPAAEAPHRPQTPYVVARIVSFVEEPDVGNLQVRFCEGR
jgi:hypothetical protein